MNRVVNCTVLSNFAAVGRLDLLRDTVGALYLPAEVYDEVLAGQMAGFSFYDSIEQHMTPFIALPRQTWHRCFLDALFFCQPGGHSLALFSCSPVIFAFLLIRLIDGHQQDTIPLPVLQLHGVITSLLCQLSHGVPVVL